MPQGSDKNMCIIVVDFFSETFTNLELFWFCAPLMKILKRIINVECPSNVRSVWLFHSQWQVPQSIDRYQCFALIHQTCNVLYNIKDRTRVMVHAEDINRNSQVLKRNSPLMDISSHFRHCFCDFCMISHARHIGVRDTLSSICNWFCI